MSGDFELLDGGFGTMLQAEGLPAGKDPTDWNVERPEAVRAVHLAYAMAGARIIVTNTFGANRLKYHGSHALGDLIPAAVAQARAASTAAHPIRVALDVGPTGRLLQPAGDLAFEDAVAAFGEQIRFGVEAGVDLILIETISDLRELKAAVLAAKENTSLPIWATVALNEEGKLLTGGTVACVAVLLESLGVDAYGFNCGLGPDRMRPHVEELARYSTRPIIVKPNAGMPRLEAGRTIFPCGPADFAHQVRGLAEAGATILGGCCGTTPDHIRAVAEWTRGAARVPRLQIPPRTIVCSGTQTFELTRGAGSIIGERINPTGKKILKEAFRRHDIAYVLREAVKQCDAGAALLDVNCGVPGLDEAALLEETVEAVQSVATVPIQIDTADVRALERALRRVNGKPLVNSVTAKRDSMDAVFPLVRKYGGVVVALCLDEQGIPETAEGRVALARKILVEGARYGLHAHDFVFDALTLSVSSDPQAACVTLETVRRLTAELGVQTVLGVSNVSFGLPARAALNNAMYALAKKAGLSAAIANPATIRDEVSGEAADVLQGRDANCANWIARQGEGAATPVADVARELGVTPDLSRAIVKGLRADAGRAAEARLAAGETPFALIESGIVPALEEVGRAFEAGTAYLPQLLMAADAAGEAFAAVKAALARLREAGEASSDAPKCRPIVLATVRGDIHDIGKNIVRALLENYGFDVIDLGRDVPPERIVETARAHHALMVGLSALMTTTVGAMGETIAMLKAGGCAIPTCVGGAVVTQEFADSIGADFYAKDAMRTVRIAESLARGERA